MNTKLTLNIDDKAIKRAKSYAKKQGRSLSSLVENYFLAITSEQKYDEEKIMLRISPELKSLVGVLKGKYPDDVNYKDIISDYLIEKYLK
jgi:predicted HicB family RNase H-like nuclease